MKSEAVFLTVMHLTVRCVLELINDFTMNWLALKATIDGMI